MKRRAKEPKLSLEIRFDSAATPARVAATARFVDGVLRGADPQLPDGSVTLVVSNYSTVAGIRAWDQAGRNAVRRCERYLVNPTKELERHPESRSIAAAFAETAVEMVTFGASITSPKTAQPIARIDERAVRVAEELSAERVPARGADHPMAGGTEVYSLVYRVGRVDDGKEIRARIRVANRAVDVGVDPKMVGAAFDAAKSGSMVSIRIEGRWQRNANGDLTLDPAHATITSIGPEWRPITGAEFLEQVHAVAPDAFSDLDDVLPG